MPKLIRTKKLKDGTETSTTQLKTYDPETGLTKMVHTTFRTRAEAEARVILWKLEKQRQAQGDFGGLVTPEFLDDANTTPPFRPKPVEPEPEPEEPGVTFEQQARTWLDSVESEVRASTYRTYVVAWETHLAPTLGDIPLKQVSTAAIQTTIKGLSKSGLAPRTVKGAKEVASRILKHAMNSVPKLIEENPCLAVTLPPRNRKESTPLLGDDLATFLETAQEPKYQGWHLLFTVLAGTGVRPGELGALKWDAIVGADLKITHSLERVKTGWNRNPPKTVNAKRSVCLPQRAVWALSVQREIQRLQITAAKNQGISWQDHGFIFTRDNGEPIRSDYMSRQFARIRDAAGITKEITLYSLRHGYATALLRKKVGVKTVSHLLGHKDIQTTLTHYGHVLEEETEEARTALNELLPPED